MNYSLYLIGVLHFSYLLNYVFSLHNMFMFTIRVCCITLEKCVCGFNKIHIAFEICL